MHNPERVDRIRIALGNNHWDLLVCSLPKNILLLTGYWPVVGTAVAIAASDGRITVLAPEDEKDLASNSWADDVMYFKPGSLERLTTAAEAIKDPLQELLGKFRSGRLQVGLETKESSEPASYAALHLYNQDLQSLLHNILPYATFESADAILADLRARKTQFEIERLRQAAQIAARGFHKGAEQMKVGMTEVEAAGLFRQPLSTNLPEFPELQRAEGVAWCMSGANSALAAGAYARSRTKSIGAGDLALVHMNSYADGYWTDITRTFVIGTPDDRQRRIYDAIGRAREAAFKTIRPGVKGAAVDAAARNLLIESGFGPQFKHSTGHGIGFAAIDANAKPRLHPKSEDILEAGMVFNVEPAVYFEGYGGVRHCDMIHVTESGPELLTPFLGHLDELIVRV